MDSMRLGGITVSLETGGVTCSISGRQLFICACTKLSSHYTVLVKDSLTFFFLEAIKEKSLSYI